ncbi:SDR family NAD(P)-dependent oxidoreductase, partial [Sphingomonas sp.]
MSRLKGRKALVTGAASGIGAATVARLLADGATVLACDISGEGMAGTFNHVANLADPQAIALLAAAAESQLGGLDILVNNAGVCPVGTLEDLTDDQWQFGLDVNLLAPARLAKACLSLLKASSAGRVINTGSILSRYGDAGLGAYAASKHAILGFTRSLAMELGPYGVTVNCVQPGCIVTGMTRGMLENGAAA